MFVRLWILGVLVLAFLAGAQEPVGVGAGGFMPVVLFLDLSELNARLVEHGFGSFRSPLVLWGSGGYGGFLLGGRMGGMGFGGETAVVLGEKAATLSLGIGGFVVENGFFAGTALALGFGLVIGGGSAELRLSFRRPGSFEDAVGNPTSTILSREFFALQPYLSVEFFLLEWAFIKVNIGYLLALGGGWKAGDVTLVGPPATLHAPVLQVLVSFGGRVTLEEEGP